MDVACPRMGADADPSRAARKKAASSSLATILSFLFAFSGVDFFIDDPRKTKSTASLVATGRC